MGQIDSTTLFRLSNGLGNTMKNGIFFAGTIFFFLSACSGVKVLSVESPLAEGEVSVSTVLGDQGALNNKTVSVAGYLCWSQHYEKVYALYTSLEDCEGRRYSNAIYIVFKDALPEFDVSQGKVKATVSGVFTWCGECVSNGPIQNGLIEASSINLKK